MTWELNLGMGGYPQFQQHITHHASSSITCHPTVHSNIHKTYTNTHNSKMATASEELMVIFAGSIIVFASTFQLSTWILEWLTSRQGFALEEKQIPKLVSHGPSYICSMVHCLVNGYRGILQLQGLYHAPTDVKLFFPPTPKEFETGIRNVEVSNTIFFAYLVFDLVHVLRLYPKLGGLDTVIHHLVFLTCSIINGGFGILPYPFCWLIIGEISTIFLNIRWGLIKTGRGDSAIYQLVQYLFALTFFITRVVMYLIGVVELFGQRSVLMELVSSGRVPGIFMGTTLFFIGAGSVLNLVWFQKIAAMAFSKKKKKEI
jgi:hypothetical protein